MSSNFIMLAAVAAALEVMPLPGKQPSNEDIIFLAHFNSASISAERGSFRSSRTVISNEQAKFGEGSMWYDGGYGSMDFGTRVMGTNNFTIETFLYLSLHRSPFSGIFGNGSGDGAFHLYVKGDGAIVLASRTKNYIVSQPGTVKAGEWFHVAVTRHNGLITLWYNGRAVGTDNSGSWNITTATLYTGYSQAMDGSGYYMTGYMDELRYCYGAVYTEEFIPPTQPFTL